MNLQHLLRLYESQGCKKIYSKVLAPNDNSKNQIYLGGNFDILNIFPTSDITGESSGDWKHERFKATLNFYWITDEGQLTRAPEAQFILYPKYPEVRFSGFLQHCQNAPSKLMASRLPNRILFLSVTSEGKVFGYVSDPTSELAEEYTNLGDLPEHGVFKVIELENEIENRRKLLAELLRIHELGWINSKRLGTDGRILPCLAPNCGGYTLEAELGITPNGFSEPDYLGWEIKQFHVDTFDRINTAVITLMTPEPTQGYYTEQGVESFIRKYGYEDQRGRLDRMNFGGIHKINTVQPRTGLKLTLSGFDQETGKITKADGRIALIDIDGYEAAAWSFAALLKHWNRKHHLACYIPSDNRKEPILQYLYGNRVILGSGTDFTLFLKQMCVGNIYYDPGIKVEHISSKPAVKRRSQFRIKSGALSNLYYQNELESL